MERTATSRSRSRGRRSKSRPGSPRNGGPGPVPSVPPASRKALRRLGDAALWGQPGPGAALDQLVCCSGAARAICQAVASGTPPNTLANLVKPMARSKKLLAERLGRLCESELARRDKVPSGRRKHAAHRAQGLVDLLEAVVLVEEGHYLSLAEGSSLEATRFLEALLPFLVRGLWINGAACAVQSTKKGTLSQQLEGFALRAPSLQIIPTIFVAAGRAGLGAVARGAAASLAKLPLRGKSEVTLAHSLVHRGRLIREALEQTCACVPLCEVLALERFISEVERCLESQQPAFSAPQAASAGMVLRASGGRNVLGAAPALVAGSLERRVRGMLRVRGRAACREDNKEQILALDTLSRSICQIAADSPESLSLPDVKSLVLSAMRLDSLPPQCRRAAKPILDAIVMSGMLIRVCGCLHDFYVVVGGEIGGGDRLMDKLPMDTARWLGTIARSVHVALTKKQAEFEDDPHYQMAYDRMEAIERLCAQAVGEMPDATGGGEEDSLGERAASEVISSNSSVSDDSEEIADEGSLIDTQLDHRDMRQVGSVLFGASREYELVDMHPKSRMRFVRANFAQICKGFRDNYPEPAQLGENW